MTTLRLASRSCPKRTWPQRSASAPARANPMASARKSMQRTNVVAVTSLEVISSGRRRRNSLEGLECPFRVFLSDEQIDGRQGRIHTAGVVGSNHRVDTGLIEHALRDTRICYRWERTDDNQCRRLHIRFRGL